MGVLLGFDPGGVEAFGWCIVEDAEELPLRVIDCGTVDNAEGATRAVVGRGDVLAAGIDSPLFWTASDRKVDDRLRREVTAPATRGPGGTVQAVNSLRGACLVQGVLLARLLRERWPTLAISESHPKAYLWLTGVANQNRRPPDIKLRALTSLFTLQAENADNDHVRDAAIAALSAWAMIRNPGGWRDLFADEKDPYMPVGHPLGYWMPEPAGALGPWPGRIGSEPGQ